MYYKWESEEAFEAWHSVVKKALGIPHPNKNNKTGDIDINGAWTTEYTKLQTDDNGVLFAKVEDQVAAHLTEGLGVLYEPYFNVEDVV